MIANISAKLRFLSSYSDIASEYYDRDLHPTCAALRELSSKYIFPRISKKLISENSFLDIGAGRSILGEYFIDTGASLQNLTILDESQEMLLHSNEFLNIGANSILASASDTGLESRSFDIIVASLGDPFNYLDFWNEISRLISLNGACLFTTPAPEWANAFRPSKYLHAAEFIRADGTRLFMPSPVLSLHEQSDLFDSAGLQLIDSQSYSLMDLVYSSSYKLECVEERTPLLWGYTLTLK